MRMDTAELIYQLIGLGFFAVAFGTMFWLHRSFNDPRLTEAPEALSEGQLRRILSWGKAIHRINAGNPKGERIMERMRLAMAELRRRR